MSNNLTYNGLQRKGFIEGESCQNIKSKQIETLEKFYVTLSYYIPPLNKHNK